MAENQEKSRAAHLHAMVPELRNAHALYDDFALHQGESWGEYFETLVASNLSIHVQAIDGQHSRVGINARDKFSANFIHTTNSALAQEAPQRILTAAALINEAYNNFRLSKGRGVFEHYDALLKPHLEVTELKQLEVIFGDNIRTLCDVLVSVTKDSSQQDIPEILDNLIHKRPDDNRYPRRIHGEDSHLAALANTANGVWGTHFRPNRTPADLTFIDQRTLEPSAQLYGYLLEFAKSSGQYHGGCPGRHAGSVNDALLTAPREPMSAVTELGSLFLNAYQFVNDRWYNKSQRIVKL